ncbi:MAG: hypothetical protein H7X94_06105, partial [Vallitaleaceae bacterium]|nr:hypothetical protein [Vallitaleaceae bacterium]
MERIVVDVNNMLLIGALLTSALLMVLYHGYIKVKTKPSYMINKFLTGQIMLIFWSVFLLLERIAPIVILENIFSSLQHITMITVGFIVMLSAATMFNGKPLQRKSIIILWLLPLTAIIVFIFNETFHQNNFYKSIHFLSPALLLLYFYIGLIYFLRRQTIYKQLITWHQKGCFLVVTSYAVYLHIIYLLHFLKVGSDVLVFGMPFYMLILIIMTLRNRFFDDIPFVI